MVFDSHTLGKLQGKVVIIQPWFSAFGHPAQSLINLAKILGNHNNFLYLISIIENNKPIKEAKDSLKTLGNVIEYSVKRPSVREGTFKALLALRRMLALDATIDRVFFLDAHLVLLSFLWPFYAHKNAKWLGFVYLMGPERVTRYAFIKYLVSRFLKRKEVVLFLRTDELVTDWKKVFPDANINCLPSLEMPFDQETFAMEKKVSSNLIRMGILGQIRTGKSIEWLVPLFENDPSLGKLTITGTFYNAKQREALTILNGFDGFEDKFLSEQELLNRAAEQDYLLMLYDDWDHRLEGAVMYLSARVKRPVIVYEKGWCGRMVGQYKNGLIAPNNKAEFVKFLKNLPKPNSMEYRRILNGVVAFKEAHSGYAVRQVFLKQLFPEGLVDR